MFNDKHVPLEVMRKVSINTQSHQVWRRNSPVKIGSHSRRKHAMHIEKQCRDRKVLISSVIKRK